jgi:exo-beta-1,3-glucanase (GH17 family)
LRPEPGQRLVHQGICYSGYREGQSPDTGVYPSPAEVEEDLRILARRWRHVRLYDTGPHAELVLSAIQRLGLDLEVLLGAWLSAEVSNPNCPWGAWYSDAQLAENAAGNEAEVDRLADLVRRYPGIVTSVAVGNEASVDWTGHLVPVPRIIELVRRAKAATGLPITFCENHVPWMGKLDALVPELDFISVHTYPVWEYKPVELGLAVTQADIARIRARHPGVPVAITEAGWATRSNGRGIEPHNAGVDQQARYYADLTRWGEQTGLRVYVFEAFDEPWKGSDDPAEPEKHWGLFTVDRRPKPVMHAHFPDLSP